MRSVIGFLRDSPIIGTYVGLYVAFALGGLLAVGGAVVAIGIGGVAGMLALFVLVLLVLAGVGVGAVLAR